MVVLKSWNIISVFLIAQTLHPSYKVHGNSKADKDDCIEQLLNAQKFNTGYSYHTIYNREQLNKSESPLSIQRLTSIIYQELECGFLYSAQLNLQLTGDVVFGNKKNILTTELAQDFSFEKEAIMMIDSLFYVLNEKLNTLWLLFVYAHQMSVFYKVIVEQGMPNDGIIANNKEMHDYVLSEIDRHVDGCSSENVFNIKSKRCEHCQMLFRKHSCWPSFRRKDKTSTKRILNVIKQNKTLLHKTFQENKAEGLTYINAKKFSFGLLHFHDEKTFTSLLEEFLIDSADLTVRSPVVLTNIINASQNGLRGIKSLGEYQRTVLGTIELIMLRITWTYVLLVDDILHTNKYCRILEFCRQNRLYDNVVENAKKFVDDIFTKFLDAMVLNDDRAFKNIFDLFVHCYGTLLTTGNSSANELANYQDLLVKQIELLADNVSEQIKSPKIQPTLSSRSLDDVLVTGKSFVYKIQHDIGKHSSIRLVESFLVMIDEKSESIDRILIAKQKSKP